jgi:hypothetical protein
MLLQRAKSYIHAELVDPIGWGLELDGRVVVVFFSLLLTLDGPDLWMAAVRVTLPLRFDESIYTHYVRH